MFRIPPEDSPWSEWRFDGRIWRVIPDESGTHIALEIRDPENHSLRFATVDSKLGKANPTLKPGPDSWFSHLEDAWENVALISAFPDPAMPVKAGISAWNLTEWTFLWEKQGGRMEAFSGNHLLWKDHNSGESAILDAKTGMISGMDLKDFQQQEIRFLDKRRLLRKFPGTFMAKTPANAAALRMVAKSAYPLFESAPLCYIQNLVWEACSFYSMHEGKLSHRLLVAGKRALLFSEILDEPCEKLNPEPFFISGNRLMAIRGKSNLLCIPFGS